MSQQSPIGSGQDLSEIARHNLDFIEYLFDAWVNDPDSVDPAWADWFATEQANKSPGPDDVRRESQAPLAALLHPTFTPRSIFNSGQSYGGGATSTSQNFAPYDNSSPEKRVPFLHQVTIFRGLSEDEVLDLARVAEEVSVLDGEYLMRQGEIGREVFIITEGTIQISREGRLLALLQPGEVIGEMSALDEQPRSADAIAQGSAKVVVLRADELRKLVEARSALALGIVRVLTQRLRETNTRQDRVDQLIRAYRVRGHLLADLDPLGRPKAPYPELDPSFYGFTDDDMDIVFSSTTIPGRGALSLKNILDHLRATYCRSIGVQFMHIDDQRVKAWLQDKMESTQNTRTLSHDEQLRILTKLTDAEIYEQFIHKKFIGAKRFSLEGAESLIPLLDMAIENAGEHGVKEVVIGMAHRGRLNVLANILDKPAQQIFREFDDQHGGNMLGRGDVKYHLGYSADRVTASGNKVHLSLAFNPSHLEFVSPVVNGRIRAKQDRHQDKERLKGMSIVIHGDAAFSGQGVVQETLNLSRLEGYTTGGTLHLIVNNQIGFTTLPEQSRSTQYATDVAKMLQIPVIHVNGERPEAVAQAIWLAMGFRETFQSDVIIDMYCYRRYGHNEGDEPAFTQPEMYKVIRARKSVRESYVYNLKQLGEVTDDQAEKIAVARRENLERNLDEARATEATQPGVSTGMGYWQGYLGGLDKDAPAVSTSVEKPTLKQYLKELVHLPGAFTPHPKFGRLIKQRMEMVSGHRPLDWAAGEALAFASLVGEGRRVRLTGQDSERGTFSHRHAVLHDSEDGDSVNIYQSIATNGQGHIEIHNSPLSEVAVLAFEYGYSLDFPEALVMWEAQFGDFANVAQVIIDQFITSGEEKWSRLSGLVMMLPHGFEGQGPEHSSARLERFLTVAADDNIQVCNLTTPAQLFHVLRRQVLRPLRKPLVIMSPKSLLRHPRAVSTLDALSEGTFQRVIPEGHKRCNPGKVTRILLTSGKLYYELEEERERLAAWNVAIVRLEQYYPLRKEDLDRAFADYAANTPVMWVQEEPKNMGAWAFLRMRYDDGIFGDRPLSCIARPASASPATGSAKAHQLEQAKLLEEAFACS
ncbi:MAG: 2-oxoglutarate dehydrogenase E1 component [Myxococcales bacterium]|nr:2-oxoglutarate dehydrogenase E1 component [Myxococcales bacterium]